MPTTREIEAATKKIKECLEYAFKNEHEPYDFKDMAEAILEAAEQECQEGWICKKELTLSIYSYMCTIHGNSRDFEEDICDDLAERLLEDYQIKDRLPNPPIEDK